MNKKENSAERVSEVVSAFRCPHCKSSMKVVDHKSLICPNNHTFDFTKQGYVNLMTHPANSHYSKELFESRHSIIMESNLYTNMHKKISYAIKEYINTNEPFLVVDLGCGEGSHLHKIVETSMIPTMTGIGLDIAKEGIVLAAKKYEEPIWLVGDLANSPLQDHAFHVILNILSPANYEEFKRMLAPAGIVIKVVPSPKYLKELRESLFAGSEKKDYKNDKTVLLFKEHFQLVDHFHVTYTKSLSKTELTHLVQMTPLGWSAGQVNIDAFLNRDSAEITVDLEILVGRHGV